jgi:uncharacterized protein YdaU (DUF1376 family)
MKYKFMPMFWGDFFANTLHLSAQEIGAYVLLIGHAWEHDAKIPLDGAQRIARVDNRHWQKVWARLEGFFEPLMGHGGQATEVRHPRVATELAKAAEISNKRKEAAAQMHSKSNANASSVHPTTTFLSTIENLPNGKGREAQSVNVRVNYRDPGVDYRSPPRAKSDNVLTPLPDKPLIAAKRSTSEE